MSLPLENRVVAITGASSGIGEATAEALAAGGAKVALGARRQDRLDAVAERIRAAGGTAATFDLDVTDEASTRAFVEGAHAELGGLYGLINNAGVMLLGPVDGGDVSEWRRMVEVNVLGLLYATHAALPLMREGGGGHIVNVSSVAGRQASAGAAVYNFTKWGVTGFSEALRQEARWSGIRVTCVEPGYVDTELQGHNTNPVVQQGIERMRDDIGELLEAGDIARAVRYALEQPDHVSINEVLVRPTGQAR